MNLAIGWKINHGRGGASVGSYWKVIEQWSTESECLEVCSGEGHLEGAGVVKQGRMLGATVWSQDSLGSQKERGCLSATEFPRFRVGKPAAVREPRSGLSAPCCHKP